MEGIGAEKSPFEEMFLSMNVKSSSPTVRPRATRFIRILSTTGSCRGIQTSTNITLTYGCSSTSRRSTMTSRLPINAMSTALTKFSRQSLSTQLRAL